MASVELLESLLNTNASEPCDNNSVSTVSSSPSPDTSSLSTSVEENENVESVENQVTPENVEEEAHPEEKLEVDVISTNTVPTTDMPLESDENSDNHCKVCR